MLKNNVKYIGHLKVKVIMLWKGFDLSKNVCEYEVNLLTNEKLLDENETFNANC